MTDTNLVTTTPTRFSVIQPTLLPPMTVLEKVDTESVLQARMAKLIQIWAANDPPNAAQYDVGTLEFDPIKINQELNTYFELLLRDRVNQAARSITLAFAVGSDLDAIASRYPYGVPRKDAESDTAYRQRVWLSPNILSLGGPGQGTFESYVFWALNALMPAGELPIKHASCLTKAGTGYVYIPILSDTPVPGVWTVTPDYTLYTLANAYDPTPTAAQISAVYEYITAPKTARKGLTDVVQVVKPKVTSTTIDVDVWAFPGVDKNALMAALAESLVSLVRSIRWLGADLTLLSLQSALAQSGVYRSQLNSPKSDITVGADGVVAVSFMRIKYRGQGE